MSEVQLRQIGQRFGPRAVLEGLDLRVNSGEYVVLLGESGSGKTTTLRLIAGLDRPTEGSIWIGGRCVDSLPPRRRDVSMVFQDDALYPHLTVGQSIVFGLRKRLPAGEIPGRVAHAAELAGATAILDRHPDRLSGGELRRASIAKSIARRAQVRLMDEPLAALHASVRQSLQGDLLHWHAVVEGTTIHVTHDGSEAMRMADKIAVLAEGQIVQYAVPEEICDRPLHRSAALAVGSPPINLMLFSQLKKTEGCRPRFDLGDRSDFEVGVRPEAWTVAPVDASDPQQAGLRLRGRVDHAVRIDGRMHLHVDLGLLKVVAAVLQDGLPCVGEPCQLIARRDQLHFFDRQTGRRIESALAASGSPGG